MTGIRYDRVTGLFGIEIPIIQAGMIWASGWKLASAVSNAGGLGIIGAGSMYPEVLKEHIRKCKAATDKPFGVNLPLLYPDIESHLKTIAEEQIPVVITSAGNPKSHTGFLKSHGVKVVHVVSSTKFALKAEDAGVDAVVAEGFEAGGHNGREETTTMVLVPHVADAVQIPVIAAGGIANARQIAAAFMLGAEGVQIGSRYAATVEASCHALFKQAIIEAGEGDTKLSLKSLTPVRLLSNAFAKNVQAMENNGVSREELEKILGRGRAKKGMFEGDLDEGELEIGQVSAHIDDVPGAFELTKRLWEDFIRLISK